MSKPFWRRQSPYEKPFAPRINPAINLTLVFLAQELDRRFRARLKCRDGGDMGVGETHPNNSRSKAPLLERVWTWLHATFPERQIYIRSDGRVQFFTFGPSLQATLAGLTLIFLGWVAFATVNVIFKDRIIAAKDHRYQQMQAAYENRVADLQMSYDELNGALVSAEDRFKSTADALAGQAERHLRLPQPRQPGRSPGAATTIWRAPQPPRSNSRAPSDQPHAGRRRHGRGSARRCRRR